MKKSIGYCMAAAVLIVGTAATLGGCSACSRDIVSSMAEPIQSMIPSPAPIPTPPDMSEPPFFESSSEPETSQAVLPALSMSVDLDKIDALSRNPITWGFGTRRDARGRAADCVALQEKYGGYNADFISPDAPVVTLTFDQGYENGFTPAILDTLKEKGVRAVFFLTGHYLRTAPELVQRMIAEGHIIGNHTNNHINFATASLEDAYTDAIWMQDKLREDYGYEMRLFRFPEGAFNEQSLELIHQMGYHSVFWSFGYNDWNPANQMAPDVAKEKIISFLHPGEIMLLHAVSKTNSEILGDVIDAIREKGYEVRPYDTIADF